MYQKMLHECVEHTLPLTDLIKRNKKAFGDRTCNIGSWIITDALSPVPATKTDCGIESDSVLGGICWIIQHC